MKERRMLPLPSISIILSTTLALLCLFIMEYFGGDNINWGYVITLVVALLGVAGTVFMTFMQTKKDSPALNSVKSDTSEIKPRIGNIDENTKAIRTGLYEKIAPEITALQSSTKNSQLMASNTNKLAQELVDELTYQKRLKQDNSDNIFSQHLIMAELQKIYEENARLNKSNIDKNKTILELRYKTENLTHENEQLLSENRGLAIEIERLSPRNPQYYEPEF